MQVLGEVRLFCAYEENEVCAHTYEILENAIWDEILVNMIVLKEQLRIRRIHTMNVNFDTIVDKYIFKCKSQYGFEPKEYNSGYRDAKILVYDGYLRAVEDYVKVVISFQKVSDFYFGVYSEQYDCNEIVFATQSKHEYSKMFYENLKELENKCNTKNPKYGNSIEYKFNIADGKIVLSFSDYRAWDDEELLKSIDRIFDEVQREDIKCLFSQGALDAFFTNMFRQ